MGALLSPGHRSGYGFTDFLAEKVYGSSWTFPGERLGASVCLGLFLTGQALGASQAECLYHLMVSLVFVSDTFDVEVKSLLGSNFFPFWQLEV